MTASKDYNLEFTSTKIEYLASLQGIQLKSQITGGSYLKLEAFSAKGEIVGYLTAFLRPVPIGTLHLGTRTLSIYGNSQ